ncbi:response regulator transcription factor [Virgibacillus soli]|uniref:Heme response regulator HssR n=1 Tax=Paracerasibacillus soli TaxID=480284 RepID=A0ABU5CN59_9BACI|nr:response regulator transcription factor [Virgibacillus soli]MDY0407675.1 response regulator transcription factor [Virgibacillus soli]
MTTILVVDDDQNILNLVSVYLKDEGFNVLKAENGQEALNLLEKNPCDMAIVDVMMPVIDGYELTKDIRNFYDIPIILLTAKDQLKDKEKGFLSGTDDYLVKPFEPKELLYRIKALFRRYEKNTEDVITLGSTVINKKNYVVEIDDKSFLLPLKEFELLFYLASHPSQVFSRGHLIERIWGFDYDGDERTVDVHIKRLRERFTKITSDFHIKTIRSVGYALEVK